METFFQTSPFALPLFIFFARILDVTLGTLRIIALSRGWKRIAPLLGFIEVFIWIVAVSQLVRGISDIRSYLAYAAGFAAGNYIGMFIEEKMAIGTLTVRIFAVNDGEELTKRLAVAGFGVTALDGHGANGPVTVLFTIIHRRELPQVAAIIQQLNPRVFYSVEEVRTSYQGVFHPNRRQQFMGKFDWIKKK